MYCSQSCSFADAIFLLWALIWDHPW